MQRRLTMLALAAGLAAAAGCTPSRGDARHAGVGTTPLTTLVDAPDQFFTRNGVTTRYRVIGGGEPVLLLHGYTDRLEMWAGTADSLARDFRVIVPDFRGFGLSTKFGDPRQYGTTMVADMTALLDHLGVRSAHVVGYSMGAMVTSQLVVSEPARVRTATLVAGPFYRDSATMARLWGPLVDSLARGDGLGPFFRWILPTWSDSAVESLLPQLVATNDSASLLASLVALPALTPDWTRIARTTVPALAIVSVNDRVLDGSRFIARHWPGLRRVELQTHDHADIYLAPEVIAEFRSLARRAPTY